jgi:DNA polymerase-4
MLAPFPSRCILHLDADAFFASLEQRDNPRLQGRPVAVGTGVVASCSYEAKRQGVRTGMRLTEARYLCRELIVVPGEYPRYEQAARHMLAICLEQTPTVEVAALDDMYLDLTPSDCPQPTAITLTEQVRDEIRLNVSIGAGTSKLIAQVATDDAKQRKMSGESAVRSAERRAALFASRSALRAPPSALVHVPAGTEREYLAPWPARVLPGVGPKVGDRLERLNVQRVGEVAAMPAELLRQMFGKVGRTLHQFAHGIDHRPVMPHRPQQSVGRRNSFDPPTGDRAFLQAMLDYLLDRAVSWMRFHRLATCGFALTIRYGDYAFDVGRETFGRPTDDDVQLREAVRDRFDRLYQRRLPLRLIGVELAPLTAPVREPTLFPDPAQERQRRLRTAVDEIRRRFGFTSLLSGTELLLADKLDRDRENFKMRTPCLTR